MTNYVDSTYHLWYDVMKMVLHLCGLTHSPNLIKGKTSNILQSIWPWMRAKSLQSRSTLCNPMDCSPPGSSVHRQECWNGLPCPRPGDLPDPGIKSMSLTCPALAGRFFTTSARKKEKKVSLIKKKVWNHSQEVTKETQLPPLIKPWNSSVTHERPWERPQDCMPSCRWSIRRAQRETSSQKPPPSLEGQESALWAPGFPSRRLWSQRPGCESSY